MKYIDINRKYTEIVANYLMSGYTVNTSTMSGSQGEKARIDLTNGTEIIRILVQDNMGRDFSRFTEIVIGKCTDENINPNSSNGYGTIWNNQLEVISTFRFRKFDEDKNGEWTYEAVID